MPEIYDQATDVSACDDSVKLNGPDGVDVAMTPNAAVETADRLLNAAVTIRGQQVRKQLEIAELDGRRPPV